MTVFASGTDLKLMGHYMTFPRKNLDEKFTILILAIGLFHFFICAKYEQVCQNISHLPVVANTKGFCENFLINS